MSSICMDIPILKINENDLLNFINFIYKHEYLLKEFGAIKIQPINSCKLSLIKRRKSLFICSPIQQIIKKSQNKGIYFVENVDNIDKSIEENSLKMDEFTFWSSLSHLNKDKRQLNITEIKNKSFFSSKRSRLYFDIHRLPNQSLLKLGGRKLTRKFVPYIKRAHGAGAIFPLSCAQHRLFSINYHHEGGNNHWYIIPNRERNCLEKIFNEENGCICLDHGHLFIDPLILDKNNIRYHKIIQQPNEFLVLSAGTLFECFSENSNWSESIDFALPSWIEDGHANISISSCQCQCQWNSLLKTIDFNLFKNEFIQKYIVSQLNKSLSLKDTITIPMAYSIQTISSNDETTVSTLITRNESIVSSFQSPPISSIIHSVNSDLFQEDENKYNNNNVQVQYKLLEEGTFRITSDWQTSAITLIDPISSEHLSELNRGTIQLYQATPTYADLHENSTSNCHVDNCFFSFEEILDLLPSTADNVVSTYRQADEDIDASGSSTVSSNRHTVTVNKRNHVMEYEALDQTINNRRILFVSGLRSDVTKSNIYSHFIGSRKVTIKQYRTTPHLKYAFVRHRTPREAKHNLRRPINFHLLGHKCRVEYAGDSSALFNNHQIFGNRKLMIARIPKNVTEIELHHLFVNCHILKYCPARMVHSAATTTKMKHNSKLIWGYAFILCTDEEHAANMIKHADQYQINGQPLVVTVYRNKKSLYETKSDLFVD